MPDWLHPTGQPSSEKGQDQMMQAKIPDIHIHKASRRNFTFFFLGSHVLPCRSLCPPWRQKNQGLQVLPKAPVPCPSANKHPRLSPAPRSSCPPRHTVPSTLSPGQGHLFTLLNVSQFHSVLLFSYNKVKLLCLTPLWLPLSLLPLSPASAASLLFLSRDLPLSLTGHCSAMNSPRSHSFTSSGL